MSDHDTCSFGSSSDSDGDGEALKQRRTRIAKTLSRRCSADDNDKAKADLVDGCPRRSSDPSFTSNDSLQSTACTSSTTEDTPTKSDDGEFNNSKNRKKGKHVQMEREVECEQLTKEAAERRTTKQVASEPILRKRRNSGAGAFDTCFMFKKFEKEVLGSVRILNLTERFHDVLEALDPDTREAIEDAFQETIDACMSSAWQRVTDARDSARQCQVAEQELRRKEAEAEEQSRRCKRMQTNFMKEVAHLRDRLNHKRAEAVEQDASEEVAFWEPLHDLDSATRDLVLTCVEEKRKSTEVTMQRKATLDALAVKQELAAANEKIREQSTQIAELVQMNSAKEVLADAQRTIQEQLGQLEISTGSDAKHDERASENGKSQGNKMSDKPTPPAGRPKTASRSARKFKTCPAERSEGKENTGHEERRSSRNKTYQSSPACVADDSQAIPNPDDLWNDIKKAINADDAECDEEVVSKQIVESSAHEAQTCPSDQSPETNQNELQENGQQVEENRLLGLQEDSQDNEEPSHEETISENAEVSSNSKLAASQSVIKQHVAKKHGELPSIAGRTPQKAKTCPPELREQCEDSQQEKGLGEGKVSESIAAASLAPLKRPPGKNRTYHSNTQVEMSSSDSQSTRTRGDFGSNHTNPGKQQSKMDSTQAELSQDNIGKAQFLAQGSIIASPCQSPLPLPTSSYTSSSSAKTMTKGSSQHSQTLDYSLDLSITGAGSSAESRMKSPDNALTEEEGHEGIFSVDASTFRCVKSLESRQMNAPSTRSVDLAVFGKRSSNGKPQNSEVSSARGGKRSAPAAQPVSRGAKSGSSLFRWIRPNS